MQETPAKTQNLAKIAAAGRWLQVSRYDRASSLLLAMLLTIGVTAALLFVVWLTGKFVAPPLIAVSPHLIEIAPRGEDGGNGLAPGGSQFDTPSDEPVVGKDDNTSNVRTNLSMLDVALASQAPELDVPEALEELWHGSRGSGDGLYGGTGHGRGRGKKPGRPGHPAAEDASVSRNWEVLFSKNTLDAYARQLDFFQIELGVLLPDNKIVYACHFAKTKPDTRVAVNPAASENRYYLTWRNGEMQKADEELLARAGVEVGDGFILKLLPRETEAQLVALEKDNAGAEAKDIRKTRFGVRADGTGFKFYVVEQALKR